MNFEKLDIFSRPFLFTVKGKREGRKTLIGAVLTVLLILIG